MAQKCSRNLCTFTTGLIAASLLGCVAGPGDEDTTKLENLDGRVIRCSGNAEAESGNGGRWVPVEAMTRRLLAFREFADFAGLSEVSNCAEAVRYTEAYQQYEASHPGFDQFVRHDEEHLAQVEATKKMIQNGQRQTLTSLWNNTSPIVGLESAERVVNGHGTGESEFCLPVMHCTGTFIGKNWILTAAHCLGPAGRPGARNSLSSNVCKSSGGPAKNWQEAQGQASWVIKWAEGNSENGTYSYSAIVTDVYQLPFWGWRATGKPRSDDFALLYLPAFDKRNAVLPADLKQGMLAGLPVKKKAADVPSKTFEMAGWGTGTDKDKTPAPPIELIPLRWAQAPYLVWDYDIHATVGNAMSEDRKDNVVCRGDSGGPLYRRLVNVAGNNQILVFGVLTGVPGIEKSLCPSDGDEMYWGRTERGPDFIEWINQKLNDFNQGACRSMPTGDPDVPEQYMCYGTQCSADKECGNGEYCAGGPDDLKNNNVICAKEICNTREDVIAGTALPKCDCVKGQCLKRPAKKNPQGDAGRAG